MLGQRIDGFHSLATPESFPVGDELGLVYGGPSSSKSNLRVGQRTGENLAAKSDGSSVFCVPDMKMADRVVALVGKHEYRDPAEVADPRHRPILASQSDGGAVRPRHRVWQSHQSRRPYAGTRIIDWLVPSRPDLLYGNQRVTSGEIDDPDPPRRNATRARPRPGLPHRRPRRAVRPWILSDVRGYPRVGVGGLLASPRASTSSKAWRVFATSDSGSFPAADQRAVDRQLPLPAARP